MTDPAKAPKERSKSFPVIPLRTAVERLQQFESKFGRHPAPYEKVGLAWGMEEGSSQANRVLAALKSFGFLDYSGSGKGRTASISDAGRTYLRAQQDGIKKEVLKDAALKPKQIARYWPTWGVDRPPDEICLDRLILKDGFTASSAPQFLKVYDDTIAYAALAPSDKVSAVDTTGDDEDEEMGPAAEERTAGREERGRRPPPHSILDQMQAAGMSADEMNRLKVLVDGDKLQITGLNVDLEGIATLKKMLEKYEDIIKLQKGEK